MNTYPLIKTKWTNEYIMAALYLLLILYHIPIWIEHPVEIIHFVLLTLIGIMLDAAVDIFRYKRLWCCVSAAVTAAIISLFTSGVPLWGQILGLFSALILGKQVWGGTGKNRINPAMVGLLTIMIFWNTPSLLFKPSYFLIPIIILSLPFLIIRPFAGLGFIAGALLSLLICKNLSITNIISDGVFFWGCIVMTDPVTVTRSRTGGLLAGFLAGFLAFIQNFDILIIIALIFLVNLFSYITDNFVTVSKQRKPALKIPRAVSDKNDTFLDLTTENDRVCRTEAEVSRLTSEEIEGILKDDEVFGMGGAAFPAYKKISTVIAAAAQEKFLLINGVECDPGLIHDHYLIHKYPEEIVKGINILRKIIKFCSVSLAVTDTNELNFPQDIGICKVSDRYPMGAEKILIKDVLNQTLEKNQHPSDRGILILNVQTVYSIYRAVYLNQPSDTRYLTVANLNDKTARVVKVHLGMKVKDIMEAVYPSAAGCFAGGGIMQAHFVPEDEIVDRNTNFIATGKLPKFKESVQCSRCGNCVRNCPAGLTINKIADLVDEGKMQDALKYYTADCINCGSCSYSCLAGRNLAVKIKTVKNYTQNV